MTRKKGQREKINIDPWDKQKLENGLETREYIRRAWAVVVVTRQGKEVELKNRGHHKEVEIMEITKISKSREEIQERVDKIRHNTKLVIYEGAYVRSAEAYKIVVGN